MLLNEFLVVKWVKKNKTKWIKLGYKFTNYGDTFNLLIEHLEKGSDRIVDIKCDYCGRIFTKSYKKYNIQRENVEKDCCFNTECYKIKMKECSLVVHGVEHHASTESSKKHSSERQRLDYNIIKKEFEKRDYILLSNESEYKNNKTKLKFICKKHIYKIVMVIDWCHFVESEEKGCKYCSMIRKNKKNKNNELTKEYRILNRRVSTDESQSNWRSSVFKNCNYTCVITNKNGILNAHHLNGYRWDVDNRFNPENGVAILKSVHKLFHSIYGIKHNTKEQFEEFKQRFDSGEFKDFIFI